MIPLFEQHQLLAHKLPYVSLGEFPTPVQKLDQMGRQLGLDSLFIKRDDLSGKLYGGNKIRKLEFILGDALRTGAKEVLTFGSAGSNHALATAIYARQLGLKSISMLVPQPNAHYVRRNLLMSYHSGAELHLYSNIRFITPFAAPAVLYQLLRHRLKRGQLPRVIPMGGSSPLGAVGYVNAAFELKGQILRGEIPEPDYIYIASGSMGTAAGLMLGLRAINSKTRVVAVRVNSDSFVNTKGLVKLIYRTNSLLSSLDPSFPRLEFSEHDMDIRHSFFGKQYALFTKEGLEAVAIMERYGGIKLEGTYTGKAFAALIDDGKKSSLRDKVLLFWNTYNSLDFSEAIATIDYHQLPRCFHRYFEEEVQPLERE
ncbi:MAG: pyridoxal-phosphate dependent enzyme [Dehalococcoidales bacterium]|nr:pyridoxal-phosphate dependent enzyme [Dehalococcoidales bacterium]